MSMRMTRGIDHPRPDASTLRGLVVILLASTSSLAAAPPSGEAEVVPIRRIADADGIAVDDGPGAGSGQSPVRTTFDPMQVRSVDLRAVEQSIDDRGPLDLSLRWVESGLRMPAGYDQVFALETGGYWRADGGLVARFSQSVYRSTRSGPMPDIPASTVFVIGGVPMGLEPGHGRLLAVDPLDPAQPPGLSMPTSVPDEWHSPSAVPGDRLVRFGFGPGYRVPVRVDPPGFQPRPSRPRFHLDRDYREDRLHRILSHWRTADAICSPTPPETLSPVDSGSEEDRSNPEVEATIPGR